MITRRAGLHDPCVAVAARIARGLLVGIGVVAAVFFWLMLTRDGGQPVDVAAYWRVDLSNLYGAGSLGTNAFLYSPAFAQAVAPLTALPFDVFAAIWRAILLVILVYLAGPFTIFVLFTVPVASEINAGNIQLVLALAIVLSFRWPATWSFVLLTKVTPGVGLLWFALRREWRALAIAFAVTIAIAGGSFIMNPEAWFDYVAILTSGVTPSVAPYYWPFWARLPFALAFIVLGAWRGWRWPVVVGGTLALPVFYIISWSMLVGVLPFLRGELGRRWDALSNGAARAGG